MYSLNDYKQTSLSEPRLRVRDAIYFLSKSIINYGYYKNSYF